MLIKKKNKKRMKERKTSERNMWRKMNNKSKERVQGEKEFKGEAGWGGGGRARSVHSETSLRLGLGKRQTLKEKKNRKKSQNPE